MQRTNGLPSIVRMAAAITVSLLVMSRWESATGVIIREEADLLFHDVTSKLVPGFGVDPSGVAKIDVFFQTTPGNGLGTGALLDGHRYLLTAAHVVRKADLLI